jgi:5-methyltetrahydrofolate--homocysteine methyltransferase
MKDDFFEALKRGVIDGDVENTLTQLKKGIASGLSAEDILVKALIPGINTVGKLYSDGEYYLPELLMSGKVMEQAVILLDPVLGQKREDRTGRYLIGSVKGDIHNIGKNIMVMMLKGNTWEVKDLGVDVPPERFCEELKNAPYDIVGLSTLLTTTMPHAQETIKAIKEAGLRDKIKIMIGGAPVTKQFADRIGADEFATDAWEGLTKAQSLLNKAR